MKKILDLIKKYSFLLLLIFIILMFNIKLPYYIEAPGGLININNRYDIENKYKVNGSINMTYVSEYKATPFLYLYALCNKDFDILKKDEVNLYNETENEMNFRGTLMLKEANANAIINAYKNASKTLKITKQDIYIT